MGIPHRPTLDELVVAFQEHVVRTRGIGPDDRRNSGRYVRSFVVDALGDGPVDVTALSACDVASFIVSLAGRYKANTVRHACTALRSFFRFLRVEGLRDDRLDEAVPCVVRRRLAGLPRHLDSESFNRLLTSLERTSPRARRDRAMILCVGRLGLRAREVVRMRLEDIDWRAGVLQVPTRKTRRGALLPLPADVGEAIVEYITNGRPATDCRHVFVAHCLHVGRPITQSTAYDAVHHALEVAGIEAPIRGPNLLRHSLATTLIRSGASLKEVADLFGHRCLETTQIYAKLDIDSLREVAQPWPEVTQ